MQIAIPLSDNKGLDSSISTVFARCPFYMLIDPETKVFTIEENPAQNASGGAGIKASQWIIDNKADAAKAHDVLSAAKMPAFKYQGGSIEETLEAYNDKKLESFFESNVDAHAGIQN